MHVANLAYKYSWGIASGRHSDPFPEGKELHQKMLKLVAWLQDRRKKSRFIEYSNYGDVIQFNKGSETRVMIAHLMMQQLLRSYFALDDFFRAHKHEQKEYAISNWQQLAEFEAILRDLSKLAFSCQKEKNSTAGISFLHLIRTKYIVSQTSKYSVVDLTTAKWSPKITWNSLMNKVSISNL